ncbi:MAG: hypothetical protein GX442_02630 [Candidatus Riflebacteria bacterium]|nr:hypothetical protein [Candidatus Riflebacteria bacterium]
MAMGPSPLTERRPTPSRPATGGRWLPSPTALVPMILAVMTGFLLIGCDTGNNVTPREGALEGTVYDTAGVVLPSVLVSWTVDRTRWGRTGTDGKFHVEGIGFGEQEFVAQLAGYRDTSFRAAIYSGATSVLQKVVMETASFDFRDVEVKEVSATTALISWKTTDYTNGIVEYGETSSLGRTVREPGGQYATLHSLEITDLKPNTKYFFRIVASRQNRPSETSSGHSFVTQATFDDEKLPEPPKGVAAALTELPNSVTIFWSANSERDLKGYRIYRGESLAGTFSAIEGVLISRGQERFVDAGVITGKKYFYRVTAVDLAGNESGPSEPVSMLIPGNLTQEVTWTRGNSPYHLAGDLKIESTGILHIDPGVEVVMADYDAMKWGNPNLVEITVKGALIASAGNDFPIVLSSGKALPAAGDWGGITFTSNTPQKSALVNVTLGYAATGLLLTNATGTFADSRLHHCQTGVVASQTQGLSLASWTIEFSATGMDLRENIGTKISGCTLFHCLRGISSSQNSEISFIGNNILEFVEFGLFTEESGGTLLVSNNLFVSATGVGLHIAALLPDVTYNTFDSPYGIRIDEGVMLVQKNILVADRSPGGQGVKGIEHLAGDSPAPVFGPNAISGFPTGQDHVGCASTTGNLSTRPVFVKDVDGGTYDYRLKTGFPDGVDPWGITRAAPPR